MSGVKIMKFLCVRSVTKRQWEKEENFYISKNFFEKKCEKQKQTKIKFMVFLLSLVKSAKMQFEYFSLSF